MYTGAKVGQRRHVPGPRGKELVKRRESCISRALGAPVIFVSLARGARIWDVDENEYIDWTGGICCQNTGHCNHQVVEAVKEQLEKFNHIFAPWHMCEPYIELAERLINITPGDAPKKVLLFNSGAEAVENAVKAARRYTGRYNILAFERAFHGRTQLAMGLTSKVRPYKYGFGITDIGIVRAPYPYSYRCPYHLNDSDCATECLSRIRQMDSTSTPLDSIAAAIIEPIQGEGGYIPAPPEFMRGLREICDDHGIVFIDDSIQTGLGRTGKMWAIEHSGVIPDILLSAKSLGGGLVLSAVVGRQEIMDATDPGGLGGTFGGNPTSCVAALKVLEAIEEEGLLDRAARLGRIVMDRLEVMKSRYDIIGDIRGLGAMIGVELVRDRKTKEPATAETREISDRCTERGLLIRACGQFDNVFRLMFPLVIEEEDLDRGMDIWQEAIGEVSHA